jgi:hypothetical protein
VLRECAQAVQVGDILLMKVYYALIGNALSPFDDELLSLRQRRYFAGFFLYFL